MRKTESTVVVIGGGFAGLSAATALAEKGFAVTVIEGRQVLGGRAYSFKDPQTGDAVDNGQHLFMGCYRETLAFLERIGSQHRLNFQENLSVDFIGDQGRRARLNCWPLPSPWHLLSGLLRLSTLSWSDRLRLRHVEAALKAGIQDLAALDHITVQEWLIQARQSEQARRHLWDLIAIATLNEDPSIAAAAPFVKVLSQAFFERRKDSRLGLAGVGLSDLYVHSARRYLEARGGRVLLKSPVAQVEVTNGRAAAVVLRDGQRLKADWIVSAVSASAFPKLLAAEVREKEPVFQKVARLRFAPIISIHLWFDREVSSCQFAGLLDTNIQWFFNRDKVLQPPLAPTALQEMREGQPLHFVSLVISGAHRFVEWNEKKLLTMALEEMRRLFPEAREAALVRSLVITEHQATLSPFVGAEQLRPEARSPVPGFLIAGDWTRTGLPATIESACVSGHRCAELIIAQGMDNASERKEIAYA